MSRRWSSTAGRTSPPWWCAGPTGRMAIVGAAAAVVLLTNLGSAPLWDDDEPKNTACSVSMLARGDWVVPRFNEALRSDKPPLVNWVQMAGFAMLGENEAGARIGSALLTVGTSLVAAAIASSLFPTLPAVGLWSGLAMGTCAWSAVAGRAATPDAGLCFFTTLALWIFVWSTRGAMRPTLGVPAAIAIGLALGGAVLAKGPVGLVLPAAAFGAFASWQAIEGFDLRRLGRTVVRGWQGSRPLLLAVGASLVAAPWYVLVWQRTDGAWVREFLFTHNVGRFSAPMEGHWGPPFYYLLVLVLGLFPWSIVAGLVIADVGVGVRRGSDAAPLRLLVTWAAVWVGCFSLSGTKLPGYVWPAYPAAAIAIGWMLERWRLGLVGWSDRWMHLAWGSLAAAGIAIGTGLAVVCGGMPAECRLLWLVGGVPIAGAAAAAWCQARAIHGAALGWVAAAGCCTVALTAAMGPDLVGRSTGVRPLVAAFVEPAGDGADGTTWSSYRCSVPGLVYYSGAAAKGACVQRLSVPEEARMFFEDNPRGCVVVPVSWSGDVLAAAPSGHREIARARSLTRDRELVLVGPAGGAGKGSIAGAPAQGTTR